MHYRATWRLVGAGQRVLGRGELDGVHDGQADAVAEILAQLQSFAVHGRDEQRNEWWAKRSSEADLELRFRVEPRTLTGRPIV
jgi:hypothetical protein